MNLYSGIVQKGGEYGRKLGFPTANVPLDDASVSGIFAARVLVDRKEFAAAVYANQRNKVLEAHVLDFDGDLYGKEITIELLEKLRDDKRFGSEDEAQGAIAADVQGARRYFKIP